MSSGHTYFRNWNDLHIVVMVARHRSFAGAAEALGISQITIAKRLSDIELALGRRLFTRRHAGAAPTALCEEILADAFPVAEAMRRVEDGLQRAKTLRPAVTVFAPPGIITYTLQPALCSDPASPQPLDMSALRHYSLPALKFTSDSKGADISVLMTSENALPSIRGAYSVRRLGSVSFRPFASEKLKDDAKFRCGTFDDLRKAPLFDMKQYKLFGSLDGWNELCQGHTQSTVFDTTRELHSAFLNHPAATLFPTYSHFYESRITPLDISLPRMTLALWLSAHEDALRESEIRTVYEAIGVAFEQSPWFH